jgi:hypothetical protein
VEYGFVAATGQLATSKCCARWAPPWCRPSTSSSTATLSGRENTHAPVEQPADDAHVAVAAVAACPAPFAAAAGTAAFGVGFALGLLSPFAMIDVTATLQQR